MKTGKFIVALCLGLYAGFGLSAQDFNPDYLKSMPQGLTLNDEVQKYLVVTNHVNSDVYGNFFNKMQVKGEYTRGLQDSQVKWNNVTVALSMQPDDSFPEGEKLSYMEDFTYTPSAEMMNAENFEGFTRHNAFAKNLVWDLMGIEGLAWAHFEELELNKPFSASDFNSKIELANKGFFENKNMVLTWVGVSERNGEYCAVIEYRTYNNPLEYAAEGLEMKGVSHYWGNIWVSLQDKQIEHATLFENITAEMKLPGQQNRQMMVITRDIEVIKLQ